MFWYHKEFESASLLTDTSKNILKRARDGQESRNCELQIFCVPIMGAWQMTELKAADLYGKMLDLRDENPPFARHLPFPKPLRRVLIIDDESDVLISIGGWLEAANMDAVRASSGEEALRLLHEGAAIDAVVTDVMMQGMSGVEFIALARQIRRSLPALVITGYAGFVGANQLPRDVSVMLKPFRRKAFMASVQNLLSV